MRPGPTLPWPRVGRACRAASSGRSCASVGGPFRRRGPSGSGVHSFDRRRRGIADADPRVDLIIRAVAAGKAVPCEKPIDLDLARVDTCWQQIKDPTGVRFAGREATELAPGRSAPPARKSRNGPGQRAEAPGFEPETGC